VETYTDKFGAVHFEAPELNVSEGAYPIGTVFYLPQAWLRVLAWGKPATLVGYTEHVYPKGSHTINVVLDTETGVTGFHPSKIQDLETGMPVFETPPPPKVERRPSNHRPENKPISKRAKKKRRKERRKRGR
jgi:hypothetical protein